LKIHGSEEDIENKTVFYKDFYPMFYSNYNPHDIVFLEDSPVVSRVVEL